MATPFPAGITTPLDWLDGIVPRVPNINLDTVKFEILVALQTFFRRSQCWRDWVGPITIRPGVPLYSVELTDYKAELVSVLQGYRMSDRLPLGPIPSAAYASYTGLREYGQPTSYYRTPEGMVALFPMLAEGQTEQVSLFVSMAPVDLCVPDWIKHRHYEAIRAGTLGSLYFMPGASYKPDLGARYEKRFRAAMSAATQDALVSGTGGPQPTVIPPTPGGSQRMGSAVASDGRYW